MVSTFKYSGGFMVLQKSYFIKSHEGKTFPRGQLETFISHK